MTDRSGAGDQTSPIGVRRILRQSWRQLSLPLSASSRRSAKGKIALVLGGDCTVELGTAAGHVPGDGRIGLVYFDLHPDLNVPESVRAGALDWMGVAHLLGLEQATEPLSHIGSRFPMLAPDEIIFYAYGLQNATPWEREVMARHQLYGIPVDEVAADPEGTAARALAELSSRCDRILIHLDVDTIDFTDLPLSENTGRNEGLSFEQTMRALTVLARQPVAQRTDDHRDQSQPWRRGRQHHHDLRRSVGARPGRLPGDRSAQCRLTTGPEHQEVGMVHGLAPPTEHRLPFDVADAGKEIFRCAGPCAITAEHKHDH